MTAYGLLRVVATGPLATIQDRGRRGWFSAGVGVSGAADVVSLDLANRLVANEPSAAAIEVLLGGLELVATATVLVAVTGAPAPLLVDGTPCGDNAVTTVYAGQHLRLGMAPSGLRAYLAVRGGIDVPPVLGSRSYDTLSGIGPPPLEAGAELAVGAPPTGSPTLEVAPVPTPTAGLVEAHVLPGPRADWFDNPEDLVAGRWVVSDQTDRVGMRLDRVDGPALRRSDDRELPTEGIPLGAVQVPPSGQPVVFLADHPVTGGYPVVGVVASADIPRLAQARPGQEVRFGSGHWFRVRTLWGGYAVGDAGGRVTHEAGGTAHGLRARP